MGTAFEIGYVLQNGVPDFTKVSGPLLHVRAVVQGLRKAGHPVRTVASQDRGVMWTDDLESWTNVAYGFSRRSPFRLIERPLRRLQYELGLPYFNLFDSIRYADACSQALRGRTIIYERHGYLGYGGVLTARHLGVPIVIELNGNIIREIDAMGVAMSDTQRHIGRWITRRTLLAADHVVVVSDALNRELVEQLRIPPQRITTVVNGVDVELFSNARGTSDVRRRYAIGAGPLVTFVGSFQPWHGVNALAEAFGAVHRRYPEARLLLVGDGEGRDTIVTQLRATAYGDRVVLTGRLPPTQVADIVHASDIAVAPYAYKHDDIVGTPLKLMEYMAAGKPIVATTARIHEIVDHGRTGLRVEPASADALAAGILTVLDDADLRARLGAAARAHVQQFSWDAVVQKLLAVFAAVTS
jgi:glycosyltransferase involved in cell wall biosynthesis